MKCDEFNKLIIDYIENNLASDKNAAMDEHSKNCSSCHSELMKKTLFIKGVSEYYSSDIKLESRLNNIMTYVNNNKYKATFKERFLQCIKKNLTSYAICALSILFLFTAKPYIFEIGKNLNAYFTTKETVDDSTEVQIYTDNTYDYLLFNQFPKPVDISSEFYTDINHKLAALSEKIRGMDLDSTKIYNIIKTDPYYEYIISKGNSALEIILNNFEAEVDEPRAMICAISAKELLGENMNSLNIPSGVEWYTAYFNKVNPMPKLAFDNSLPLISSRVSPNKKSEIEFLLKEIKTTKFTNDAPKNFYIRYSTSDKIIFFNNKFIIAYDNTAESRGIYNIIKAKKIDNKFSEDSFNHLQCDKVSPDGNYALISFYSSTAKYNFNENLNYLYDFKADSYTFIGKGFDIYNSAWSQSSNYFVVQSPALNQTIIFSTANKSSKSLATKDSFNPILVSDEGNVVLSSSNINNFVALKNHYDSLKQINIIGLPLNFNSDGIQYWDGLGNINNFNFSTNENTLYKNVGANFKFKPISDGSSGNDSTVVFQKESTLKGYDIFTKELKTISSKLLNNYDYTETFSPDFTKSITGNTSMHASIKNSDGIIKTLNIDNRYDALSWIDDTTLVAIIPSKTDSFMGAFKLVTIDSLSGKAKVLLEP